MVPPAKSGSSVCRSACAPPGDRRDGRKTIQAFQVRRTPLYTGRKKAVRIYVCSGHRDALAYLSLMGKNIVHTGPAGTGQHTKLANQVVIASTIMGVCEGLAYARAAGLKLDTVLQCIGGGVAGSVQLTLMGPRIARGDYAPGFMIEHFLKDLSLALEEAGRMAQPLPGAQQARKLYEQLAANGHGREGTQALARMYGALA